MALTQAEYQRRYRARHPERRAETVRRDREVNGARRNREYRARNAERLRPIWNERAKAAYQKDLEASRARGRAQNKKRYAADPSYFEAYARAWKEANPERRRGIVRRYQQSPRGRERHRANQNARRARKLHQFIEDVDPIVVFERDRGLCGICGDCVDVLDFHVDHVIPLARGGEHSYANSQLSHPQCNLKKGITWPRI